VTNASVRISLNKTAAVFLFNRKSSNSQNNTCYIEKSAQNLMHKIALYLENNSGHMEHIL